ncbi:MAG: hypothetical protein IJU76_10325, partial [Desulfovibrionaceae bacterium]|nr:hypothetical protein [Desulfovibrionaceae bacterium]
MHKQIPYTKWSPAQNTTLFFPLHAIHALTQSEREHLASMAMLPHMLSAEQTGFIDTETKSLSMAGGEFCLNATRAFGAHLHRLAEKTENRMDVTVTVSGWPTPIRLVSQGFEPTWLVAAHLPRPP